MSKMKKALISLIILTILGSIVCFYGTNLVLSDISNMFYMTVTKDFISSLPILIVALEFVLAAIAVIRIFRYPQYKKAEANLYSILLIIFGGLGVISAILTGTIIYHSFTAPYPFAGATILTLIWHIGMIVLGILGNKKAAALEEGKGRRHQSVAHIAYSVFLSVLLFATFDRLGAVLFMPFYVYLPTFHITIWFYLAQLLPLAILLHVCLHAFDADAGKPKFGIIYDSLVIAAIFVLGAIVAYYGTHDTQFISSVSPAVGIERLITMPVDTIVIFVLSLILALYSLYVSIKHAKKR